MPEKLDSVLATKRDLRFWLVFVALAIATGLNAIDLTISTALPTIIRDLNGGSNFIWVGAAYTLCATAFIPLSGNLAQLIGRRPLILGSLFLVAVGSAVAGSAHSMSVLIGGRVMQGLGGGGISSSTAIIISDLVNLQERGLYNSFIAASYGIFCGTGPIIAGSLSQEGHWRWFFYLNIPICGLAGTLLFLFLRVPTPAGSFREKLAQIDWIGNLIVIASSTLLIISLTWGGSTYSWRSGQVLVLLITGLVGLGGFFVYEAKWAPHPVAPFGLMSTRTGLSGYLQLSCMAVVMIGLNYYAPVYFQACKGLSPTHAGVYMLVNAFVAAVPGVLVGASVKRTGRYRLQMWLAWVLMVIGMALLVTVNEHRASRFMLGYLIIASTGVTILTSTTYFPVLAPLDISQNALALAFFMFVRSFAQVWGVTIGGTVLQNGLEARTPQDILADIPGSASKSLEFALITTLNNLPPPVRNTLRAAFADSLRTVWIVFLGVAVAGLISSLFMRGLQLHTAVDEKWALRQEDQSREVEKITSHGG